MLNFSYCTGYFSLFRAFGSDFYHFMNPETLASKCLISVCYVWLDFSVGLYAFVKLDLVISSSQKSCNKRLKVSKEV